MKLEEIVKARSGNQCELSKTTGDLVFFEIGPNAGGNAERTLLLEKDLVEQIEKRKEADPTTWERILPTSMWDENPAVQVLSWRMLQRFRNQTWASDALEMIYLDDDNLEWAKATGEHQTEPGADFHKDCNGNILVGGDTVTLIKDLDVKGSTINVKIGTAVRNIRLVHDNTEQIEGKIDGQMIVILTKFVKKQILSDK